MGAYLGRECASPGQKQITPSPAMCKWALSPSVHSTQEKGIALGRCHSKHFSLKCCGRLPEYGYRDTDSNGPVIWTADKKNYHTDLYIKIFWNYLRTEFLKPKYFGRE